MRARIPWNEAFASSESLGVEFVRSPLAAFEGLVLASMISTLFWSTLTLLLFRHR